MERYDDALDQLGIIVDLKPDDFDARRKVGLIYLEQKRWREAVAVFEEILDLRDDLISVRYYLGTAYERLSEWQNALDAFLTIEEDTAFYDDAVSHISYIYMETGRLPEAITLLDSRIASGAARPQIYNYLATLYMTIGENDKAISVADKGMEAHPENIELLYRRGLLLERVGRHDEAMQTMEMLLSLDAEHAEALNFLAYGLAVANRDLDDALGYAERAISLKSAPHILDTLGWVYYRKGRLIEALKVIEEASLQLQEDAVILEHLGDIHSALNNIDKAQDAFERALKLVPDNEELRNKLDNLIKLD
jgi:tetratricopeptide (TPR) repeat protein